MRFRKVFAVCTFTLAQVRHSVKTQAVNSQIEPEIHSGKHGLAHLWILPVEIWLVRIKSVPVISFGYGVPGPVGTFKVLKDNARVAIFIRRITPNIKITPAAAGRSMPRTLKPEMLVRRVVQHQFSNYLQAAAFRFAHEALKIL